MEATAAPVQSVPAPRSTVSEHLIEYVARDQTGITTVVTTTSVIDVNVVIDNIRAGHSGYFVAGDSWRRTPVRSLTAMGSPYLFANWDGSKRNNLHDLAFRSPRRPHASTEQKAAPGRIAAFFALLAGVGLRRRRAGSHESRR
jgi:hypothetical protein